MKCIKCNKHKKPDQFYQKSVGGREKQCITCTTKDRRANYKSTFRPERNDFLQKSSSSQYLKCLEIEKVFKKCNGKSNKNTLLVRKAKQANLDPEYLVKINMGLL